GHIRTATLVAGAAVVALPTVILAFMFGQSRIFYVMARDGLLPRRLSQVNAKTGTPVAMTLITGVIVAALAGFLPLQAIAELANAGTLCAFIAVALCMLVLRGRDPGRIRPFRAPLAWVVGPFAILGCLYLFTSLPAVTIAWFFGWNAVGLLVYALVARRGAHAAA
ncbi:MAG: amino acid permease, partial [Caulobacteraceae bacterium]|nr:amino acid permease [Caulobacter sp.]